MSVVIGNTKINESNTSITEIIIDDIELDYYCNKIQKFHYVWVKKGENKDKIKYYLNNIIILKFSDLNIDWDFMLNYVKIMKNKTIPDYKNIKTWDELIQTNVDFIKGKYYRTFYHGAPLDDETINNRQYYNSILKINELGLFTVCSQPATIVYHECDNKDCSIHETLCSVYFFCEKHIGDKIISKLINNDDIYMMYETNDTKFSNLPEESVIITNRIREDDNCDNCNNNWKIQGEISNKHLDNHTFTHSFAYRGYPNFINMIDKGYYFLIFGKDIKKPISVPQLLIDVLI